MNIGEANNLNTFLRWMFDPTSDNEEGARNALMLLSDRAFKALLAGLTGQDVALGWPKVRKFGAAAGTSASDTSGRPAKQEVPEARSQQMCFAGNLHETGEPCRCPMPAVIPAVKPVTRRPPTRKPGLVFVAAAGRYSGRDVAACPRCEREVLVVGAPPRLRSHRSAAGEVCQGGGGSVVLVIEESPQQRAALEARLQQQHAEAGEPRDSRSPSTATWRMRT